MLRSILGQHKSYPNFSRNAGYKTCESSQNFSRHAGLTSISTMPKLLPLWDTLYENLVMTTKNSLIFYFSIKSFRWFQFNQKIIKLTKVVLNWLDSSLFIHMPQRCSLLACSRVILSVKNKTYNMLLHQFYVTVGQKIELMH